MKKGMGCPNCSHRIDSTKIVPIDSSLTQGVVKEEEQKRLVAKELIQKASKMSEESRGQLDPDIWEQLYLSVDLPTNVPKHGMSSLTTIPREVAQHFRATSGLSKVHERSDATRNSTRCTCQATWIATQLLV